MEGIASIFIGKVREVPLDTKRDTPERMSLQYVHCNKALQRRVIRVSEMFVEYRSSGDARPERSEWSACPFLLPQAAALQKPAGLFADRLRP